MNRYLWKILVCSSLCLLNLISCDHDSLALLVYHTPPVNERVSQSLAYNELSGYPVINISHDTYRIYVCSDTHLDTTAVRLQQFVWTFRQDTLCPVALCLGDLMEAEYSHQYLVETIKSIPPNPAKNDTFMVAVGNHEMFFDQWQTFVKYWPTTTYYFVAQSTEDEKAFKDLYICLDSAQGTLGEVQMVWLRNLLTHAQEKNYRHIVVYTHINLFRRDNTYADIAPLAEEETMELMALFKQYHVEQFWSGHDHAREMFTHGGVKYIVVDTMRDKENGAAYMIVQVDDSITNIFKSCE